MKKLETYAIVALRYSLQFAIIAYVAIVCRHYWNWFVAPQFGLAELSWTRAFVLRATFLTFFYSTPVEQSAALEKLTERQHIDRIGRSVSMWTMFLAFGWVLHWLAW